MMFPSGSGAPAGTATKVFGQPSFNANTCNQGGNAGPSTLCYPEGVAIDRHGTLYVSDTGNNRVLEYVSPYPVSARIALGSGWNLVSLPSQTSLAYTAAGILGQIDAEGGQATALAVYRNGAYSVYVPGFGTDFAVDPTQGFFVLATTAAIWAVK